MDEYTPEEEAVLLRVSFLYQSPKYIAYIRISTASQEFTDYLLKEIEASGKHGYIYKSENDLNSIGGKCWKTGGWADTKEAVAELEEDILSLAKKYREILKASKTMPEPIFKYL